MTNVVFASLRSAVNRLLQHDEGLSNADVLRICSSFRGALATDLRKKKIIGSNTSLLSRFQHVERSLSEHPEDEETRYDVECTSCALRFTNEMHSKVINRTASSGVVSAAMTESVIQWVFSKTIPPINAIFDSTPACAVVAEYLTTEREKPKKSWTAILGLDLMSQSYRVYLHYLKKPELVPKSRITALKLAKQVHSQVEMLLEDRICFPCRCPQTLGWHLQSMAEDLQAYASLNCWDLMFQAPWVAGNHVLEILALSDYYGLYLLKYRHYIGATLHSYNALRQWGGLRKITALEKICVQFAENLFPGGPLPSANFHACWARHVGARLKFLKNHKGKHNRDNWCLSIPAHAAKVAAGIGIPSPRPNDKTGCILFDLKQQDYHVKDEQWTEIDTMFAPLMKAVQQKGPPPSSEPNGKTLMANSETWKLVPLAAIAQKIFSDPPGSHLPMARINLFAVFERCVRVVSSISKTIHPRDHRRKKDHCICFANDILDAADRLEKGRQYGRVETWEKVEVTLVNDTKRAILAAFGNVELEDLLWEV
jgi:hypothetical protein